MVNPFKPSPLQKLEDEFLREKGIELYVKRDDLIHPEIQGNKWRKLKYNLFEARLNSIHTLLTFGGPYSNHIYATAAAGRLFHFKTIGIIRGEEHEVLTPTLQFAESQGMELYYMDRESYRERMTLPILKACVPRLATFTWCLKEEPTPWQLKVHQKLLKKLIFLLISSAPPAEREEHLQD